jgi:hypothetical protein
LDRDISEEEIRAAVMQSALEKAQGPDGYIGAFYKFYWETIKTDLIGAITEMFALRAGC